MLSVGERLRTAAASSESGTSRDSSTSSSRSSPEGDHNARLAGYPWVSRAEPCQTAYSSDAFTGGRDGHPGSAKRSSSGTARGSGSSPRRATSRWATWFRPDSSPPQVTSAAELPATRAIPLIVAQRGAGSVTSNSAGVQRNVYQSGQAPRG